MTQEEKQLFVTDLCARFPYRTTIYNDIHGDSIVTYIDLEEGCVYLPDFDECRRIEDIKPYLRPMSSMTKEEKEKYKSFFSIGEYSCGGTLYGKEYEYINSDSDDIADCISLIDWLNANHFDYRGLIPMGLALEAPEGMYGKKKHRRFLAH